MSARTAATWRSTWSPAREPGLLVERREAVDVEQGDRDLAALPLRPGDLELEDAAERPRVRQPGQRVGVRDALEPLGALGRHRRRSGTRRSPPPRGPRSRPAAPPRSSRPRGSPSQPNDRTPDAGLDARRRRPRAAGRRTSSSSRRAPPTAARASRSGRAPRDGSGGGVLGHHRLEARRLVVGHARASAAARGATRSGSLREQRRHGRARRGRTGLDDHREGGVQVVRAGERRRAGRQDGERPGRGAVGFGHVSLRMQVRPAGCPPDPPTACPRPVETSRHRTPARRRPRPRRPRRGRLSSPR